MQELSKLIKSLAESMANAVANMPSPIVTVEDINLGQKRVSVAENNSTL